MDLAVFLIFFPLVPALILLCSKSYFMQKWTVVLSSIIIAIASIWISAGDRTIDSHLLPILLSWMNHFVIIGDIILALVFLYICRRLPFKRYWIPLMVILQYGAVLLYDFTGKIPETTHFLYVDTLSSIMALIIGLVGGLIAIYTVGYMRHYHYEHHEIPDRTRYFLAAIFLFFFAMFGIVFSNSLTWIYFFWEVTTLCSFIMISYSQTEEAKQNAMRALWMLLLGGLSFAIAIIFLSARVHTINLQHLLTLKQSVVLLPVMLLCFAGINKAALFPFGNWLLGAMVAPTPSSALLHSSTMVKAGVYLVLRCAPILKGSISGEILALLGGLSFLGASAMAIAEADGKRILALSTIANLGLIVLCAGIGTPFALWAALLIIIFHAVAKALMFLCVGTVAQQLGDRNVESMEGLISKMPLMTIAMLIGISGMFLAPFGMLISKWMVIEALTKSNPLFTSIVIFGGSMMLFFWTKWMGKIVIVSDRKPGYEKGIGIEWIALVGLSILVIATCVFYPFIGRWWIQPLYGASSIITHRVELTLAIMLALMLLPPIIFLVRFKHLVFTQPYLAGLNIKGTHEFVNSLGDQQRWGVRNYYLSKFFGEKLLMKWMIVFSIVTIILMFAMVAI